MPDGQAGLGGRKAPTMQALCLVMGNRTMMRSELHECELGTAAQHDKGGSTASAVVQ